MIERNSEGKAIFRSSSSSRFQINWYDQEEIDNEPKQLELDFQDTQCKHTFEDDGKNLRMVCTKCGYFSEVSFRDPYDGKTYQEVYEIMQKRRKLTA
jgi:hypothetical protein